MHNFSGNISGFSRWQHNRLKHHYGGDSTELFFAKALSFILLSSAVTMLVFNIYFIAAGPDYLDTVTKLVLLPVYTVPVLAFAIAYHYLIMGHYNRARNIFTTITIIAIISSINLTGGFFGSIASPFLVVVPVIVFLLYGTFAGAYIAVTVPAYIILQTALVHYTGLSFPDFTSDANPQLNTITTNLALYLLVLAMVASYDYQRNNLRSEVQKEREKLADLANRDPLTGLSNSRHLFAELEKLNAQYPDKTKQFSVFYLDLNKFKQINDNFGHRIGDQVLIEISRRIQNCAGSGDMVARMGGDEFVILVQNSACRKKPDNFRLQLRNAVCAPIKYQNVNHMVGISIGQCIFPDDTTDINSMLQMADQKMYEDKNRQLEDRIRNEVTAMPHFASQKSA